MLGKILQASRLVEEQVRGVMAEAGSCGVLALQVRMGTPGTSAYSVLEQSDLGLFWLAAMGRALALGCVVRGMEGWARFC